jgi:hypothetical protein
VSIIEHERDVGIKVVHAHKYQTKKMPCSGWSARVREI